MNAMQRYSLAAMNDGLEDDTIRMLASLANWGHAPSNTERDFHRMMPYLYGVNLETFATAVEVFDADKGKIVHQAIPILLASDVVSALWNKNSPRLWEVIIGCTSSSAALFWKNYKRCASGATAHPVIVHAGCMSLPQVCAKVWPRSRDLSRNVARI